MRFISFMNLFGGYRILAWRLGFYHGSTYIISTIFLKH